MFNSSSSTLELCLCLGGRIKVSCPSWELAVSSLGLVTGTSTVAARPPGRRVAGNRCPPPSPTRFGFRIFVRAVRRRIWFGRGTMIGTSASSPVSEPSSSWSRTVPSLDCQSFSIVQLAASITYKKALRSNSNFVESPSLA